MTFKRVILLVLTLGLLASLFGCGDLEYPDQTAAKNPTTMEPITTTQSTEPTASPEASPEDGIFDVGEELLPLAQTQIYDQLFDPDNKIEIDLDMEESQLEQMQADYEHYKEMGSKSPIYRRADVTVSITTAEGTTHYRLRDVGVRMKGNTSRNSFYKEEEGGIYKYIHLRLDFQETFDDTRYYGAEAVQWSSEEERLARKDRTFATLEKLELRWNKCYDATYIREIYAYELYRSEGVLAPRAGLTTLNWNDANMGVYTIVEPVDKVFLEKNLKQEDWDGDLYKCGWTWQGANFTNLNSVGIENEDNSEFYCYDLKTNKKTSQHESLTALINGLNKGVVTKERFAELVDTNYFLRYAAVSYFLGNPDDLRNNYNNCYLYFLKSTGKAIIIPYDYDRCLGVTRDYNPSGHGMTREDPFSDEAVGMANGVEPQNNPLFLYSVVKGGFYVQEYADVLQQVSENELLKSESFEKRFQTAAGLYGNDVIPERTLHNAEGRDFSFDLNRTGTPDSQDNMSFKDYINLKKQSYQSYAARLSEYLSYERPVPARYYIRGDFNDWSNRDNYAMKSEGDRMVFTLSFNRDFSFKVYDDVTQEWYGTEFLPEDTELEYDTNGHANIILKPGTYKVSFDPETVTVDVEKVS